MPLYRSRSGCIYWGFCAGPSCVLFSRPSGRSFAMVSDGYFPITVDSATPLCERIFILPADAAPQAAIEKEEPHAPMGIWGAEGVTYLPDRLRSPVDILALRGDDRALALRARVDAIRREYDFAGTPPPLDDISDRGVHLLLSAPVRPAQHAAVDAADCDGSSTLPPRQENFD